MTVGRRLREDLFRSKALQGLAEKTDNWAKSENPVKRRIGSLEIAWREGMQWLAEDIRKMFENFGVVADAYDVVDVNVASVKSLCIEKGVFTEEEFQARRKGYLRMLDEVREKKQRELEALQAGAKKEPAGPDPDPELERLQRAVKSVTPEDHVPKSATIWGGGS